MVLELRRDNMFDTLLFDINHSLQSELHIFAQTQVCFLTVCCKEPMLQLHIPLWA